MLRRNVHRLRIERIENNRERPLPAFFQGARWFAREESRIRLNVARLAGAAIVTRNQSTLAAGIKDVRVGRTRRDVTALAATNRVHADVSSARILTGDTDGAVVLLRAADLVRKVFRRGYVVKLCGRIIF